MKRCLAMSAVLVLGAARAAAGDLLVPRDSAPGPLAPDPHGLGPSTLAVAVVCAVAGAWLFWRNRKRTSRAQGGQMLSVSESRSLGNRQYLVVATYGDQKFLVGVCTGRISLIAPLDGGPKAG